MKPLILSPEAEDGIYAPVEETLENEIGGRTAIPENHVPYSAWRLAAYERAQV